MLAEQRVQSSIRYSCDISQSMCSMVDYFKTRYISSQWKIRIYSYLRNASFQTANGWKTLHGMQMLTHTSIHSNIYQENV
ncbi:hypothetical protein KPH14_009644 [Odynerus spinipes]|uniref:Uncharacterized protein n=1 Tax=Odynerus spinipes TaxID=1348599 RepID=A0AAD9VQV3_9HYME|nr:hypothetical protein KPH14_009644 [Odynerus spinipes]